LNVSQINGLDNIIQISSLDRVCSSTASHVNEEIDLQTDINIHRYKGKSNAEILERIQMLDKEWDIERVLEVNASALALSGLILGLTKDRKWLFLPSIVLLFFAAWITRMVSSLTSLTPAWYPYPGRN
jgi:hypothetical protein